MRPTILADFISSFCALLSTLKIKAHLLCGKKTNKKTPSAAGLQTYHCSLNKIKLYGIKAKCQWLTPENGNILSIVDTGTDISATTAKNRFLSDSSAEGLFYPTCSIDPGPFPPYASRGLLYVRVQLQQYSK